MRKCGLQTSRIDSKAHLGLLYLFDLSPERRAALPNPARCLLTVRVVLSAHSLHYCKHPPRAAGKVMLFS